MRKVAVAQDSGRNLASLEQMKAGLFGTIWEAEAGQTEGMIKKRCNLNYNLPIGPSVASISCSLIGSGGVLALTCAGARTIS